MPRPTTIKDGKRPCSDCGKVKLLREFRKLSGLKSHLYDSICIVCRKVRDSKRKGSAGYRERINLIKRTLRLNPVYKEQDNERQRNRYHERKYDIKYMEARRKSSKKYQERNHDEIRKRQAIKRRELRSEFVKHYGGKCSCCGENHFEFLTLEHINGGGRQERKKMSTERLLYTLKKGGWKKDGKYGLLCFNCNQAKGAYGYCPHKKK